MAAYIGPLFLVLLGISGFVYLLSRRLRTNTGVMDIPLPASSVVRAPRPRPGRRFSRMVVAPLVLLVRWSVAGGRLVLRLPQRVRRKQGETGDTDTEETSSAPTRLPEVSSLTMSDDTPSPSRPEESSTAAEREAFERMRLQARLPQVSGAAGAATSPEVAETMSSDSVLGPTANETVTTKGASEGTTAAPVTVQTFQDPVAVRREEKELAERAPRRRQTPPRSRPVALEPHVRELRHGRQKVVGRVHARRSGEAESTRSERPVSSPRPPVLIPEETPSDLSSAARLLENGELTRAESMLTDVLTADPRELGAYRLLGQLYVQRHDFILAKEVCEEALRRHPEATALYGLLGRAYFELGQYGKALQVYQRAHDADEKNLEYLERLLQIATRMDRRPLVRVTAEKILALHPQHAEAKKCLTRVASV